MMETSVDKSKKEMTPPLIRKFGKFIQKGTVNRPQEVSKSSQEGEKKKGCINIDVYECKLKKHDKHGEC